MRDDNYPPDIRDFDHDYRSPFYIDPTPPDDAIAEEVAQMVEGDEGAFWDVVDKKNLYRNIWEWYVKTHNKVETKMDARNRQIGVEALANELHSTLDDAMVEILEDQAIENIIEARNEH